jgi:aldose 1-epimerase
VAGYTVSEGSQEGLPTRVLRAAGSELEAAFAPKAGMIGCSLRHRGEELLGQRGGLARYAAEGSTMGIPLLHPWANRLDGTTYSVAGRTVELDPATMPVRVDGNGLPIHGLASASPYWEISRLEANEAGAWLRAELDWGAQDVLMSGFPFPHVLAVEVRLSGRTLTLETELRAGAEWPVPVSFGYHPYLTLPGVPRAQWEVELPVRRHARLDDRGIPTGETEPCEEVRGPLGDRTYDDLFSELAHPPEFRLHGGGRTLQLRFEQGYPLAQVYAPPGEDLICFEPMTAPTNALVSGDGLQLVGPGETYPTRFSLSVYDS